MLLIRLFTYAPLVSEGKLTFMAIKSGTKIKNQKSKIQYEFFVNFLLHRY